jgi:hypothetical protein
MLLRLCSFSGAGFSVYAVSLDASSRSPVSLNTDLRPFLNFPTMEKEGRLVALSRSLSDVLWELKMGRAGGVKLGAGRFEWAGEGRLTEEDDMVKARGYELRWIA